MRNSLLLAFSFLPILVCAKTASPYKVDTSAPASYSGMKLVFDEEFNYTGKPDSTIWNYETGFVRNHELQWYQCDNANVKDGRLLIEGKQANFENPSYDANSKNWKKNRKTVNYTASSITTMNKKFWKFGRFEIRARIDTAMGAWPAIWFLGIDYEWPSSGEIDMLEFYRNENKPIILANFVSGTTTKYSGKWNSSKTPLTTFTQNDKDWVRKYHVWRMDWTKDSIHLYLDDRLLNKTSIKQTVNPDGTQPFLQPQYLLLNLALGENGGDPSKSKFPITFEVDYVRVYQQEIKK